MCSTCRSIVSTCSWTLLDVRPYFFETGLNGILLTSFIGSSCKLLTDNESIPTDRKTVPPIHPLIRKSWSIHAWESVFQTRSRKFQYIYNDQNVYACVFICVHVCILSDVFFMLDCFLKCVSFCGSQKRIKQSHKNFKNKLLKFVHNDAYFCDQYWISNTVTLIKRASFDWMLLLYWPSNIFILAM